jgi:hypothetical protein
MIIQNLLIDPTNENNKSEDPHSRVPGGIGGIQAVRFFVSLRLGVWGV